MTHTLPRLAALALALPLLLGSSAIAQAPPAEGVELRTVEMDAPSVGRTLKYNVVLPEGYDDPANADRRYPVLYMLHGLTSNYVAWSLLGVPRVVDDLDLDLIVVMPDVGNSWYVNWAESEGGGKDAWEDYIIKDLIEHVEGSLRTVDGREGRGIIGLSMGGYGAMTLGLRHPDMFCTIGSHSGALGIGRTIADRIRKGDEVDSNFGRNRSERPDPRIGVEDFDSQAERTPEGTMFATVEQAEAHDPFRLVREVKADDLPHIYLDCGTDDFLYKDNTEFARQLLNMKVPFTYAQSEGGHTPPYWSREVSHSMAVQYAVIRRALANADE